MGIKIFSPLSYSEGKLYGLSPSTPSATTLDLTFARNSTNRTRVSNRGVVQDVPYNLLSFSEEFDNTAWTKTQSIVTPNAVQPPNNPNYTADLVYPTGSTAFVQTSGTTTTASGGTYYFSVYARSAGKNFIMLNGSGGTTGVWYNLSTGVIGTQSAGNGYILNMGNGWYYCVWFGNLTGALQPIIRISDADNSTSNTASGTNGVFLWGAQLSQSTAVQPYFKTTNRLNVPAIDYSLSTGGSGCLLMEPQRTNLLTYSQDFDNIVWTKTASSVNPNTILSPSGDNSADFLVENTSSGVHGLERSNLTILNNTVYTGSVYAKSTDRNIRVILLLRSSGNAFIDINLTNGSVMDSGVLLSYSVNNVGNGWYKISLTNSSTTTTGAGMYIFILSGTTATYTGNGTSGVSLWGAQIEQGAYPTSYIPTTAASATRLADSFTRNSLFSNNYVTAAGGTWFIDLDNNIALARDAADVGLFLGDTATGTTNSFCINTPSGSSRMEIDSYVNGSATTLHVTTTDRTRAAIKWNGSTADVFVNGSKVVSGTTFTGTTLEYMGLNVRDTPKYIRGMWLAPVPLTDADLISATRYPFPPIVTNGLVLYLDAANPSSYSGTSTTWTDLSGFGNNGTLTNGPTYVSGNGGSISFDGVNDIVGCGNVTQLNSINVTISCWVSPLRVTNNVFFSRYYNFNTDNGILLGWNGTTNNSINFNFGGRENSGAYLNVSTQNIYSLNNWYHITGVKIGNIWKIYINGVLVNSITQGVGNIPFLTNPTQIGGIVGTITIYSQSRINNVQAYNRALSDAEVLQNFNATRGRFNI